MWDLESKSIWSPFDGVALEGPSQGAVMTRVPCLQTTWHEWISLHPDTDVIVWAPWPTHRDARHGHGTNKWLGSPGVEPLFTNTIELGRLDTRLPENELTLGVQVNGRARSYPLAEVRKGNHAINDEHAGVAIVVFAAPDSHTMAAYARTLEGRTLDFERREGAFRDRQTGSAWNIEGVAVDGPLRGKRLTPVDFIFIEWHTWSSYHRGSEIFTCAEENALAVEEANFARLFEALRGAGYSVRAESPYLRALLPLCAEKGFTASVNGDRLSFFLFGDVSDALDYTACRAHSVRVGRLAVQSDPADIFTDETLLVRKDEAQIAWSRLIEDAAFLAAVQREVGGGALPAQARSYSDILRSLRQAGYRAELEDLMLGYILPPKAINGVWARINGDRFMVMRFQDEAAAREHAGERAHRACAGAFVFRSDPEKQYRLPDPILTVELPEEQIEWSKLPDDARFGEAIRSAVGQ